MDRTDPISADKPEAISRSDAWETDPPLRDVVSSITRRILDENITDREKLQKVKMEEIRKGKAAMIPPNSMILDFMEKHTLLNEGIRSLLMKKPSRTLSGVAVVAVMTSPHPCPHGKCIFCPGGHDREVPTPQSYTGKEPAAMRAEQHGFNPGTQVESRLRQLESIGHKTDKVELILMGGTLTARDLGYQRGFVKGCIDGLNGLISKDLRTAQTFNETAVHRCIGMTFETRPDRCGKKEIDEMLDLGATRVELGFQSAFDPPLRISGRGHSLEDSVEATALLKDAGLKVNYHLMPGIPGSDRDMDIETARMVFDDPRFKPDMIKIYPTLIVEGTELYEIWKEGKYNALSTREAAEIVAEIKSITPPWVRIQRVQRDIPAPLIEAGVKMSNLRQIARDIMHSKGQKCGCIRCREIGHVLKEGDEIPDDDDLRLVRRDYDASGGREVFLSFEEPERDILVGFLRLRKPSDGRHRPEITPSTALIRELKVFGPLVPIGEKAEDEWQHRGYGTRLMREAEDIASSEWNSEKIVVNSGVGVRDYYRRFGYRRIGPYMGKFLDDPFNRQY